MCLQAKRTNLKKPSSERTGHGLRVKFNPLALLLDASLEGEFDLVQRVIYEVPPDSTQRFLWFFWFWSKEFAGTQRFLVVGTTEASGLLAGCPDL